MQEGITGNAAIFPVAYVVTTGLPMDLYGDMRMNNPLFYFMFLINFERSERGRGHRTAEPSAADCR